LVTLGTGWLLGLVQNSGQARDSRKSGKVLFLRLKAQFDPLGLCRPLQAVERIPLNGEKPRMQEGMTNRAGGNLVKEPRPPSLRPKRDVAASPSKVPPTHRVRADLAVAKKDPSPEAGSVGPIDLLLGSGTVLHFLHFLPWIDLHLFPLPFDSLDHFPGDL